MKFKCDKCGESIELDSEIAHAEHKCPSCGIKIATDVEELPPVPNSENPVESDIGKADSLDPIVPLKSGVQNATLKVLSESSKKAAQFAKDNLPQHGEFVKKSFLLFLKRCKPTKAIKAPPTIEEATALEKVEVIDKLEQNIFVWRRSFLLVGIAMLFLTVAFRLFDFPEAMSVEGVPPALKAHFVFYPFIIICFSLYKAWRAYLSWKNLKSSRKHALHSALALSGQLILLSFIPLTKTVDVSVDETYIVGASMALLYSAHYIPVVLGLIMGLMRGCIVARVFYLDKPVFGSMLLVSSWMTLVVILFLSGVAVQISGSLAIVVSFVFMLGIIVLNIYSGYKLKGNIAPEKVISTVSRVEDGTPWLIGLATIFAIVGGWDLFKHLEVSFIGACQFIIGTIATYCLVTVAFFDLVSATSDT